MARRAKPVKIQTVAEGSAPQKVPELSGSDTVTDRSKKYFELNPRFWARFANIAYPVGTILFVLVSWAFSVEFFDIKPYMVPSPDAVFEVLIKRFGLLVQHTVPTVLETLLGLGLAIAIGVPFAIIIVSSRAAERAFMPLLVGAQCFPKVAVGPLLIVWFGWGLLPKILISFFISFFPIVIQTVLGLKSVERDEIDLIRTMSSNPVDVFVKIRIPNALPYFFGGLKVSVTLALIGAIVGEFIGADRGLGYLLQNSNNDLNTPLMFAALFFLVAIGVALFSIVTFVERWLIPWHVAIDSGGHSSGRRDTAVEA